MDRSRLQTTDIEPKSRLAIIVNTQSNTMSNRMNLDFMMNGRQEIEVIPEESVSFRPLLALRPRPVNTQMNDDSQPLESPSIKSDTETEASSPTSSTSGWSLSENGSHHRTDRTLPPMRLQHSFSESSTSYKVTGLPPIQCPEWSTFFGQRPTRDTEAPLPRLLCNSTHGSHSCGNCWSLDEFGARSWNCCQCRTYADRNHALKDYHQQLMSLAHDRTRQLTSLGDTRRASRSPRRHDPYARRASYPTTLSHVSRVLPPSPTKGRPKSNGGRVTKAPHSNKKYLREQVYWMRYKKEDCGTKFETMASDLWELQWPGSRPYVSHQSLSSRTYRDNLVPLLDRFGQIVYTECGKLVMDSAKVRDRNSPEHKGIPYTFVEKLPHQALMYEWVSEEHKAQARKIIEEDEKDSNSKAAIYRRALREFETAINPPANAARPSGDRNKLADAAGYVILVENKSVKSACSCTKKSKHAENEEAQVLVHPRHCPANSHPALRLCDCAEIVRSRTALHLPGCASLRWSA